MKTYITTAIPYVNGVPHLGHAEDYLLADIYSRYRGIMGDDVRFQAGTDEHGNKIEKKALELDVDVKKYVEKKERILKFNSFAYIIYNIFYIKSYLFHSISISNSYSIIF